MLWLHLAIGDCFGFKITIREYPYGKLANDEADTKAKVGNTSFASVKAILIFKDGGKGREEKVEVAVNYGYIDSEEEDNRWAEKHFSWADDGSDEQVAGCLTFIIFRFQVKIAGFFAEQLGFVF